MRKLSNFLRKYSPGWVVLASLIVFVVFSGLTLPVESARAEQYSQGMGSPDTALFYNNQTLVNMAENYGEEGRSAYVTARWGFDLAFPFIYTLFYITSISYFFRITRYWWLNLLPLGGLVFDLAENTAASLVMSAYPDQVIWAERFAPIFTPVKWIFVAVCMLLVGIGLIFWLWKNFFARTKET